MLVVVLAVQALILVLLVVLLGRKSAPAATVDARLNAVPDELFKLGAKLDAVDAALRNNVSELRYELGKAAHDSHGAADKQHRELRGEINGAIERLVATLNENMQASRKENSDQSDKLRESVVRELTSLSERLQRFFADVAEQERQARAALDLFLSQESEKNSAQSEALRQKVEAGLRTLNTDNAAELGKMREVVDEKLQSTLNERLTVSFGAVSDQLTRVHAGLGEMKELATGVSDLKKVFSNVKSRGGVGEFHLGMLLEQMFSAEQYEKNVAIKPNSLERVEYALKVPQGDKIALLPMDSKFPTEDWGRLENAYEVGGDELKKAGEAFERAIRAEAKKICEKYIYEPRTLPHAILFLPTEALYSEVTRRSGLIADIQQNCKVTIAGPATFGAILTAFRMGFHLVNLERKGSEVWDVLGSVKSEFSKFGELMTKVEGNVEKVQKTLGELGVRTRAINRNLRNVSELPQPQQANLIAFEDIAGVAPLLAAMEDDTPPQA